MIKIQPVLTNATSSCLHYWTYPNKGPVTKVVNGAEEPKLVKEKICSGHGALI